MSPPVVVENSETSLGEPVEAASASAPSRTEISEEVKNVPGAVEDTLDQTLRDEVTQSGLKLATPKALKLPDQKKVVIEKLSEKIPPPAVNTGTTAAAEPAPTAITAPAVENIVFPGRPTSGTNPARTGRVIDFSLQTGSYPKKIEAESALADLNARGLEGEIRTAEIRGKGTWFRVVVGKYKNAAEAEKAGKGLKEEKQIEEFIVVKAAGN